MPPGSENWDFFNQKLSIHHDDWLQIGAHIPPYNNIFVEEHQWKAARGTLVEKETAAPHSVTCSIENNALPIHQFTWNLFIYSATHCSTHTSLHTHMQLPNPQRFNPWSMQLKKFLHWWKLPPPIVWKHAHAPSLYSSIPQRATAAGGRCRAPVQVWHIHRQIGTNETYCSDVH